MLSADTILDLFLKIENECHTKNMEFVYTHGHKQISYLEPTFSFQSYFFLFQKTIVFSLPFSDLFPYCSPPVNWEGLLKPGDGHLKLFRVVLYFLLHTLCVHIRSAYNIFFYTYFPERATVSVSSSVTTTAYTVNIITANVVIEVVLFPGCCGQYYHCCRHYRSVGKTLLSPS